MNFYCLTSPNKEASELLKAACEKRGINYTEINPEESNFLRLPKIKKGDLLYRSSANNPTVRSIENALLHPNVVTFHKNPLRPSRAYSHEILPKFGISTPRTIPLNTTNKAILKEYSEALNGFPIIIKSLGGEGGIGVIKVDSLESLFSMADFLNKTGGFFILREFIDVSRSIRAVVLDREVIASVEYISANDDFRTNRKATSVKEIACPEEIKKLAVDSLEAKDLEFGGVDILIFNNKPFVLEVNFPCYFAGPQKITGVNIAEKMLDYLIKKSKINEKQ